MNFIEHGRFLKIAKIIAEKSKCTYFKVGCLLVKESRIISTGYNGTPSKNINCNEVFFNCWGKGKLKLQAPKKPQPDKKQHIALIAQIKSTIFASEFCHKWHFLEKYDSKQKQIHRPISTFKREWTDKNSYRTTPFW